MENKIFQQNKLRITVSKALDIERNNIKNISLHKYLLGLNTYQKLNTQILNIKQEHHNLFGEKKPRLKIKKRVKIGIRAQLRKETPDISLKNFYEEELEQQKNICEDFLNLKQINIIERFSRILHINKINFICRNIDKINENKYNKKKRIIIRKILQKLPYYKEDIEDKDNIIIQKQEKFVQYILKNINKKFNKKNYNE
jgi:hypothetical protein